MNQGLGRFRMMVARLLVATSMITAVAAPTIACGVAHDDAAESESPLMMTPSPAGSIGVVGGENVFFGDEEERRRAEEERKRREEEERKRRAEEEARQRAAEEARRAEEERRRQEEEQRRAQEEMNKKLAEIVAKNHEEAEADRKNLTVEQILEKFKDYKWTREEAERYKRGEPVVNSLDNLADTQKKMQEAVKGTFLEGAIPELRGSGGPDGRSNSPDPTKTGRPYISGTSDEDWQWRVTQRMIDKARELGVEFNEKYGIFRNSSLFEALNNQRAGAGDELKKVLEDAAKKYGHPVDIKMPGTVPTEAWQGGVDPSKTK